MAPTLPPPSPAGIEAYEVNSGCGVKVTEESHTEEPYMSLKSSFAIVLRALRCKRNLSQRDFCDTSRTFLSKLEGARSSLTLDKLEQVSQRLELSSLTLLTLTLSQESGKSAVELIDDLRSEIEGLERDGGVPGLDHATHCTPARKLRKHQASLALQTQICFQAS